VQALWMLSEFTAANGATRLLPRSHQLRTGCGDYRMPRRCNSADYRLFEAGCVVIEGQPGDLLLYLGQVWHTIGVNQTQRSRTALLAQFLPYYVKPMESNAWTLSPRTPASVRGMLGMNWDHHFMHSTRPGRPRTPAEGVVFCFDCLWHGSAGIAHPVLVRTGLQRMWPDWLPQALLPACERLAPLPWSMYRLVTIVTVLLLGWADAVCLTVLLLGFMLGALTTLERVRM
jgi:hypothetical protein